jgi:hypothetical protein
MAASTLAFVFSLSLAENVQSTNKNSVAINMYWPAEVPALQFNCNGRSKLQPNSSPAHGSAHNNVFFNLRNLRITS